MPSSKKSISKRIVQTGNYRGKLERNVSSSQKLHLYFSFLRSAHSFTLECFSLKGECREVSPLRSASSACQGAGVPSQGPLTWKGRFYVQRARDTAVTRLEVLWLNLERKVYRQSLHREDFVRCKYSIRFSSLYLVIM